MFNTSKYLPKAGAYPKPLVFATLIPRDNLIVPTVTGNARQFIQTTTTPAASTRLDNAKAMASKYNQQIKANTEKGSENTSKKLGDNIDGGINPVTQPSVLDTFAATLGVSRKVVIGGAVALLAYYILSHRV